MKSTRAKAILTRARKRYADGGALGKADLGDFRQNDPIREMYRAVMDQYFPGDARANPRSANVTTATRTPAPPPEGDLPPIWRTTMQGGATARATPSNAAAKGDLGAPATDTQPGIWEGVRASARPPTAVEDPYWAGMNPVDRHRLLTEIRNNQKVSPEQMAANGRQNTEDLLSITPVIGNIMAAENAARSGTNAALDIGEGKYKSAAINSALALLSGFGAVTGLPTGKTVGAVAKDAGRTAGVFVPGADSPKAVIAEMLNKQRPQMFTQNGGKNAVIHDTTGLLYGAEGALKREIPDRGMNMTGRPIFKAGDEAPLKDVVNHPELFNAVPKIGEILVKFETPPAGTMRAPIARSNAEGAIEMSAGQRDMWVKRQLAKLMNYQIAKDSNFAAPVRHGVGENLDHMDATIKAVQSGIRDGSLPPGTALSYLERLQQNRADVSSAIVAAKTNPEKSQWLKEQGFTKGEILSPRDLREALGKSLNSRVAGNVEASVVRKRFDVPKGYPFAGERPFSEQIVLPNSLEPDKLGEFIRNFASAPKFANGGKVAGTLQRARQQLASGGLIGHTPGRADKLPVKAAEGSYVIPADVVAALGEGNSMAGHKVLFGRFPGALGKGVKKPAKPHLATGGRTPSVDIIVSDGEFIVTPEDVAALGGGDIGYGHDVLDAFVTNTRKQNIQTLSTLPGPKT